MHPLPLVLQIKTETTHSLPPHGTLPSFRLGDVLQRPPTSDVLNHHSLAALNRLLVVSTSKLELRFILRMYCLIQADLNVVSIVLKVPRLVQV